MKIIKQKRKTLSLKIDNNGEVIVKAPILCSKKQILSFVEKHKSWILEKQEFSKKTSQKFMIGETFLFLGEEYLLKESEKKDFYFSDNSFFSKQGDNYSLKNYFIDFYKKEAKKYITERVKLISEVLDLSFNKLRITSATTRWGSCSTKKNINFSWRLIMAPRNVIDYVIIHELAHLREMNHSQKFWNLVVKYSDILGNGNYKNHKKWLKKHGLRLGF